MKKISLIGAGNIGTILAYSISRKKLGNIVLVDVLDGLAKGKCLDLSQSLSLDNISADIEGTTDLAKIKQSDVIIITAGIARKPGMSRDDLIETNLSMDNVKEREQFLRAWGRLFSAETSKGRVTVAHGATKVLELEAPPGELSDTTLHAEYLVRLIKAWVGSRQPIGKVVNDVLQNDPVIIIGVKTRERNELVLIDTVEKGLVVQGQAREDNKSQWFVGIMTKVGHRGKMGFRIFTEQILTMGARLYMEKRGKILEKVDKAGGATVTVDGWAMKKWPVQTQ